MKRKTYKEGILFLGDCIQVMQSLPRQSVDLVFGSPPYESQREYDELQFNLKGQDWVDWMVLVFEESLRVCKGLVVYVVGHGTTSNFRWSASPALLMADLHRKGICLRSPKWYRRYGIPGSGGPDDLRKDAEFIVCATNGGRLPWSDTLACASPWKHSPGGACSHRDKKGRRVYNATVTSGYEKGDARTIRTRKHFKVEAANPGDIIDCGSAGGGHLGSNIGHENEAPFPEKLANFFIRSFCPPDGTVMDPFGGSGTTAAVAIKTGRRFIIADKRKSQTDLIRRRIKQARGGKGFGL